MFRNPLIKFIAIIVAMNVFFSILPGLIGMAISILLVAVVGRCIMGLYFICVNRPNYVSWVEYLSVRSPDGFVKPLKFAMFSSPNKFVHILGIPSYALAFIVVVLIQILVKVVIFVASNGKIKEFFDKKINIKKITLFKDNIDGYCPKCLAIQVPSFVHCPNCDKKISLKSGEDKTILCPSCNNKYDSGKFYKKGALRAVCPSCNTYPLMSSKFNSKKATATVLFISNKSNCDIYRKILEGLRTCESFDANGLNSYYEDLYDSNIKLNGMFLKVSREDLKQKVLFKSILLESNSNLAQKISIISNLNDIVFLATSNNIENIKNEIEVFVKEYSKFAEFGRNAERINIYIMLSASFSSFNVNDIGENNNMEDVILAKIFSSNLEVLKMKSHSIRIININKENLMTEGDSYKYLYNLIIKNND